MRQECCPATPTPLHPRIVTGSDPDVGLNPSVPWGEEGSGHSLTVNGQDGLTRKKIYRHADRKRVPSAQPGCERDNSDTNLWITPGATNSNSASLTHLVLISRSLTTWRFSGGAQRRCNRGLDGDYHDAPRSRRSLISRSSPSPRVRLGPADRTRTLAPASTATSYEVPHGSNSSAAFSSLRL